MISERIQPTFQIGEDKYYYFFKHARTDKGEHVCHFFIFDENGYLDECRYFISVTYVKVLEQLLKRRSATKPSYFCYYELDITHENDYPQAHYSPIWKLHEALTQGTDALNVDSLYALEIISHSPGVVEKRLPDAHYL